MVESNVQTSSGAVPVVGPVESQPYSRRQQLLQNLLKHSELLLKNGLEVRHLMSLNPVVVSPSTTLAEMTSLMQQHGVRHLLVSGRGGEVVGVISDRDLQAQRGATAQQLMSFPVLTVAPESPLGPAITYLIHENISCLPVVEHGQLLGLLTTTDLLLTLQCSLQLWVRLAQALQHDTTWMKEFDKIIDTIDEGLSAEQLRDRLQQARRAMQLQVQNLAHSVDLRVDAVTGMSNRRGLEEVLDMLLAVYRRFKQPFSLVLVELDHFSYLQKSCGDSVVKLLLKALGRLIEQSVRDCDFAAWYRESTFAVVMPQAGREEAEAFCARLRESARKSNEMDIELRINTTAVFPEAGENAADLLERAGAALA